jgi:hypothetical protein
MYDVEYIDGHNTSSPCLIHFYSNTPWNTSFQVKLPFVKLRPHRKPLFTQRYPHNRLFYYCWCVYQLSPILQQQHWPVIMTDSPCRADWDSILYMIILHTSFDILLLLLLLLPPMLHWQYLSQEYMCYNFSPLHVDDTLSVFSNCFNSPVDSDENSIQLPLHSNKRTTKLIRHFTNILLLNSTMLMMTNKFPNCLQWCVNISGNCIWQQRRCTNFEVSDDRRTFCIIKMFIYTDFTIRFI